MRRIFFTLAIVCGAATFGVQAAQDPPQKPLYSLTNENDGTFTSQDRHYTQGLLFTRSLTIEDGTLWADLGNRFGTVAGWLGAGPAAAQRYTWPMIGQSMFTPENTKLFTPNPKERPYAGWLYIGAALTRTDTRGRTDQFQLLLGDVGSWALASQVQNGFHKIAGYGKANGWNHQLHNEPALFAQYQTTWDFALPRLGPIEADFLPAANVTLGNVLTYGAAGATLRFGQNLAAGDTPRTIMPGASGTGWFEPAKLDHFMGWFVYGAIQERAVWRNIFLQGNSWRDSPSVPMKHFVTDENVGVAFLFRFGLRVDITYIKRSKEFFGQNGDDRIGSVTLSAPL